MASPATDVIPWFRQPLVWLVIGIPLSSVIMGAVILTLSITSYDGLVADDYYKRGLEINRVLHRDSAASEAGLGGILTVDPHATRLTLETPRADVVLPAAVEMKLSYSTRSGLDRQVTLSRRTLTDYEGPGVSLAEGRWYVEVGTLEWRLTGQVDAPHGGNVVMQADR